MSGFRLGKFFGINTYIHWSWLLIFALVTWSLASTLKQVHPEWSSFDQVALALVAALLFFLSVLGHEIAHSLVAEACGHPVRSIIMFLFGGVSDIQKEPTTPRHAWQSDRRTVASKRHRPLAGIAIAHPLKMSMSF
jgi:Zn-dependent protease